MFRYENVDCPVCEKTLTEQNDVVVCPECGAPHHRECWSKQGACRFEDKHGTPEAWQPPQPPRSTHKTLRCPHCGAINAGQEERCNDCGKSMLDAAAPEERAPQVFSPSPFVAASANMFTEIPKTEKFEDATAEEISLFVGSNAGYYLKKFWLICKMNKLGSFNFAALLFPGLWMLYRKMYRKGSIVTAVVYGLEILSIFINLKWTMPLIEAIYSRAGVNVGAYDISSVLRLSQETMKLSAQEWLLISVPMLLSLVVLGISIYLCVMGNKLYYRHTLGKLRGIRSAQPDAAPRRTELQRQGGINLPIVLSVGVSYYIISGLLELYLFR